MHSDTHFKPTQNNFLLGVASCPIEIPPPPPPSRWYKFISKIKKTLLHRDFHFLPIFDKLCFNFKQLVKKIPHSLIPGSRKLQGNSKQKNFKRMFIKTPFPHAHNTMRHSSYYMWANKTLLIILVAFSDILLFIQIVHQRWNFRWSGCARNKRNWRHYACDDVDNHSIDGQDR